MSVTRACRGGLTKTYQDGVRAGRGAEGRGFRGGAGGAGGHHGTFRLGEVDAGSTCSGPSTGRTVGTVEIGGQRLAGLSGAELAGFRNRTIGFVFQFHQLLPDFTALENVMLPGRIAGSDRGEVHDNARRLLREVGLEERLDHFPNQLSGGERQRVALCRALALEPPLLLADQPTGNLDPESGEQVFALLLESAAPARRHGADGDAQPRASPARCGRVLRLEDGVLRAISI